MTRSLNTATERKTNKISIMDYDTPAKDGGECTVTDIVLDTDMTELEAQQYVNERTGGYKVIDSLGLIGEDSDEWGFGVWTAEDRPAFTPQYFPGEDEIF